MGCGNRGTVRTIPDEIIWHLLLDQVGFERPERKADDEVSWRKLPEEQQELLPDVLLGPVAGTLLDELVEEVPHVGLLQPVQPLQVGAEHQDREEVNPQLGVVHAPASHGDECSPEGEEYLVR